MGTISTTRHAVLPACRELSSATWFDGARGSWGLAVSARSGATWCGAVVFVIQM